MGIKKPFTAPIGVDLANNKIVNVATPTDGTDAVNKTYGVNASNISTGTLGASYGGTGITSYSAGDVLFASTSTSLTKLAIGGTNTVLTSSGNAPQWSSGLTLENIVVNTNLTINSGTANGVTYLNSNKQITSGSGLTFNGTTLSVGAATLSSGNLTFSGTGQRITGAFSGSPRSDRLMFQNSGTNLDTRVGVLPNGTNTVSELYIQNSSDANNTSIGQFLINASEFRIASLVSGTATQLPMTFFTAGSERMRVTTAGNIGIGTAAPSTSYQVDIQTSTNSYWGTRVFNSNTGTSASSSFQLGNDTNGAAAALIINSSSNTAIIGGANALVLVNGLNAPLLFGTNGAERMRLAADGKIAMGGTTTSQAVLTLHASIGVPGYEIRASDGAYVQFYNTSGLTDKKYWRQATNAAGEMFYETINDAYTTSVIRVLFPDTGGVVVGSSTLTTTTTTGFLYAPTCSGVPTGAPVTRSGTVPIIIDTTNHRLYFYSGGSWRNAGP